MRIVDEEDENANGIRNVPPLVSLTRMFRSVTKVHPENAMAEAELVAVAVRPMFSIAKPVQVVRVRMFAEPCVVTILVADCPAPLMLTPVALVSVSAWSILNVPGGR